MRTTLDIPDDSMKTLLKLTKAKTKTEAVTKAVDEFIRRLKIEELIGKRGKVKFHEDWEKMEKMELKKYENTRR